MKRSEANQYTPPMKVEMSKLANSNSSAQLEHCLVKNIFSNATWASFFKGPRDDKIYNILNIFKVAKLEIKHTFNNFKSANDTVGCSILEAKFVIFGLIT